MKIRAGDKIGDYIVLNEIAAGGMGKIFRVQNIISRRIDAMKVLLPDLPRRLKRMSALHGKSKFWPGWTTPTSRHYGQRGELMTFSL